MASNLPPGYTDADTDRASAADYAEGWHDYDDYPDPRECDHTEYDSDIITGVATCSDCGYRWMQSNEEIAAEHERIKLYHEQEESWRRWERWDQIRDWFRNLIPRRRKPVALDDEIPF